MPSMPGNAHMPQPSREAAGASQLRPLEPCGDLQARPGPRGGAGGHGRPRRQLLREGAHRVSEPNSPGIHCRDTGATRRDRLRRLAQIERTGAYVLIAALLWVGVTGGDPLLRLLASCLLWLSGGA